jgi:NADH-quinone oxidoreductase subunit G
MRGGPAGVRLFDGRTATPLALPEAAPSHANGAFLLLPQHHVFGSDELSARAPAVAELIPAASLGVNTADAGALGLQQGGTAEISIDGETLRLSVTIVTDLPAGTALVSAGWPQTAWLCGPVRATLRTAASGAAP